MNDVNKPSKGKYSKYMSKEYKIAWNKLWMEASGVVYFKNLDDEIEENETASKL